jgi:hypothetical protein
LEHKGRKIPASGPGSFWMTNPLMLALARELERQADNAPKDE